ncbi:unnamed protein product [Rangifer tarandus platyrhynchus]|uniref:Solute carrier family 15 member 5 n=2 Tax=Rangifer tarandus platyrhynchus TaxID=3082113 RepID=A0ABN8YXJ1_RANTA|nr:unnamed protein product [Rangifer tarandus platyrhynchus]CAI9694153.1 unnamed protein product [Rangifer tarandus platyrhynchus]
MVTEESLDGGFKNTDERVPLNHSIEKEKTIRHIGYLFCSYSVQKIQVGICLLLAELCERFVFFEVVCNMIPFCIVKLGYRNYQAAILNLCFIGASILTRVFAGWLADVCLGRNKLVHICLFLHFLGSALLSVAAFPLEDFYIGTHHLINNGLVARWIEPLLGSQTAGRNLAVSLRFYWIMNLSATVVFLGISYIQHSGAWALVLLIPFMSTLMALITLYMMHYNLIYQPEKCCSLLTTFRVFVNALKTCCLQYCHLGGGVTSWLGHAKEKNGGRYSELLVEDTKFFFNLLPLFIFHLLYKTCIMRFLQDIICRPTGLLPSKRDGSFLSACILAGNLSAALSVLVAGFLEIHRKRFPPVEQPLSGKAVIISSMLWSHLVLQYVLLGVAETLVNPAFSVIYRFVPSTIRGTFMNCLTLTSGFACFMGALLLELVYLISEGNWFPNTLNKGNLENFFFFLASLTLLNVLGFWSVSQRYCNLNHFNAQNTSGSNLEETLSLQEKSLKFYGSTQEFSSSIDLWETAL